MTTEKTSLQEVIGKGYDEFWRSKKRYVVCKGSKASKKSTTAALKIIVRLMQYPLANALVIRQTLATLNNSCYAQLKWAINRLGVEKYWKCTVNPLQMIYLPFGNKIIFRGMDDPDKIASITVERGHLCWAWLEEAWECGYDDWKKIDLSLRGKLPEGYYIQWLITFNPWAECWLKELFFDNPDENTLAMTTTYKNNEFLSDIDIALYDSLKKTNPEMYRVVGEGDWGRGEGQFFKEWRTDLHVVKPFEIPKEWVKFRAMDWGMAKPYAVLWFAVDYDGNIYVYRELYGYGGKANVGTGETASQVGRKIALLEKPEENISYGVLDNACWARTGVTGESIAEAINNELYKAGLVTFGKSSKGRVEGANAIKERLIGNTMADGSQKPALYFFENCTHSIRTIPMLGFDKHNPETYDTQGEDHCFVAGTLITTKRGDIPIEQVTTDDLVLTRKGYRKVLVAGLTKKNTEVMTVEFSNGKYLTGTPNHPVFVKEKEFIPLDALKYDDIIYSVEEMREPCQENSQIQQIRSYSTELNLDAIQIQNELGTESTIERQVAIVNKGFPICTGKFGNFTMEKFPKVITFIIKTEIVLIMIFLILNCSKDTTIYHNILKKNWKMNNLEKILSPVWTLLEKKLMNGTSQKKGASGIDNTDLNVQKKNQQSQKSNAFVCNVENTLTCDLLMYQGASFVQTPVIQNTDVITELTMKREFVQSVARNLEQTNIQSKKFVGEMNVGVKALHKVTKKADVYNLTVDEEHEYFANGILVHNCTDAVAYGLMSRPFKPVKAKLTVNDKYRREDKPTNWSI